MRFWGLGCLFAILLAAVGCKSTGAQAGPFPCLENFEGEKWSETAKDCPAFLKAVTKLADKDANAVLLPLITDDPVGTNVDGLWVTFYGEMESEGKRIQATVVYTIRSGQLCVGHWREGDAAVSYRCSQNGQPPPPMKAWIDDEN